MGKRSDIHFSTILKFGVMLLAVAIVVHVLMWILFDRLNTYEEQTEMKPSPMAPRSQEPPEPRLQVNPTSDLQAYRESDAEMLNHYGWVDKQAGVVHIPISEAMKLVVEREQTKEAQPIEPPHAELEAVVEK